MANAINIASELVGRPGPRLVAIGGIVRSSFELVGPAAEAMLANYHFDIAFIGVDGLTPQEGCTTHDEMEAQTDLAFLRRARRSIVIADSSKIGKVTFARICNPAELSHDPSAILGSLSGRFPPRSASLVIPGAGVPPLALLARPVGRSWAAPATDHAGRADPGLVPGAPA